MGQDIHPECMGNKMNAQFFSMECRKKYIYIERENKSNSDSMGGGLEIAMIRQELQKKGPSGHQCKYIS